MPHDAPREPMLAAGMRVEVPEFGDGTVAAIDGDKVDVTFPDGETRRFKREFLEAS